MWTSRLIFLGALLLAVPAGAARGSTFTAVFTVVEGNITVAERPAHRSSRPVVRRARPLQVVRSREEIHVPAGARMVLVCSNDHGVFLSGIVDFVLTEEACRAGQQLQAGTFGSLAPKAGHLCHLGSALALARETRGEEEAGLGVPILLSPRNTAVLSSRPEIVWSQVSGATDYSIEILGGVNVSLSLRAIQASCEPMSEKWGGRAVCSAAFPSSPSGAEIPPGGRVAVTVKARRGIASPLRWESEVLWIQRLPAGQEAKVRKRLADQAGLSVGETARHLLAAGIYAENKLYADAIAAYRDALAGGDLPEVRVTLGDVYFVIGLLSMADRSYREALSSSQDPAVRAGAELGLGRIEYARRSYERAIEHFHKARKLYKSLGLTDEAKAAKLGAKKARERL